jgi:hypothetical protein
LETRHDYYRRIGAKGLAPLWEVLGALVPREVIFVRITDADFQVRQHRFSEFQVRAFESTDKLSVPKTYKLFDERSYPAVQYKTSWRQCPVNSLLALAICPQ